jgi:hypothetical protein
MRRLALALMLLAPAVSPVLAQSAAQQRAADELQRGIARDRVSDAARDLETGGRPAAPALVDDMNRDRPTLAPERRDSPAVSPRSTPEAAVPLLGDNVQR